MILKSLGTGLLHSDEVIGNACSNGLAIALSYNSEDAIKLHGILNDSSCEVLKCLFTALKRFGNGDHTDENRASLLAKASGIALASTTVRMTPITGNSNDTIGSARLECVEALFALLGSQSYRKDPEMMLEVGEALSLYSDAFSPVGATWSWPTEQKPKEYKQSYANECINYIITN